MKEVTKQQHAGFLSSSNFKLNCKTEFNPPHWVSKSPWFPSAWPPRNSLITHPLFLFRGSRAPEGIFWPRAKGVSAPPSIRSRPYYIFYTCKIYYRHSRKLTENGLCTGYPKGDCLMPFIALSQGGVLYKNLERERKPPSNFKSNSLCVFPVATLAWGDTLINWFSFLGFLEVIKSAIK